MKKLRSLISQINVRHALDIVPKLNSQLENYKSIHGLSQQIIDYQLQILKISFSIGVLKRIAVRVHLLYKIFQIITGIILLSGVAASLVTKSLEIAKIFIIAFLVSLLIIGFLFVAMSYCLVKATTLYWWNPEYTFKK